MWTGPDCLEGSIPLFFRLPVPELSFLQIIGVQLIQGKKKSSTATVQGGRWSSDFSESSSQALFLMNAPRHTRIF